MVSGRVVGKGRVVGGRAGRVVQRCAYGRGG